MSKVKEIIDVNQIVREYDIPNPPVQYCPTCGAKLDVCLTEAKRPRGEKFNPSTGRPRFIVYAKYSCPTNAKHRIPLCPSLSNSYNALYWTERDLWLWDTIIEKQRIM